MNTAACRYNFDLKSRQPWKDMLFNRRYFWGMWGVKQTLVFMVNDTLRYS